MTFLPLVGAAFILVARGDEALVARNARNIALWTSLLDFALSLLLWIQFDPNTADFQFVERADWVTLGGFQFTYHMGIDGISLFFVLLSTLLTLLSIVSAWEVIQFRVKEFMIAFLVLETLMVGIFCALDFVLFYVFFEGVLIPMFLIIGVWGGSNRIYSAFKFFLYTLLGSVLDAARCDCGVFRDRDDGHNGGADPSFPAGLQRWLWLAFFASFAVKVPMWPVHTWLPDAHVEAPTAGSVILAGILLKLGGYGFVRFSLPMFPLASGYFTPLIFTLSAIAVIYTSLVASGADRHEKADRILLDRPYGVCHDGHLCGNERGCSGRDDPDVEPRARLGALFFASASFMIGLHTHEITRFGGLVERMPAYAFVFMVFTLAARRAAGNQRICRRVPDPARHIQGQHARVTTLAATALFLGPAYMLYLYRRVIFGTITRADLRGMLDLSLREKAGVAPLLVLVLWMGLYPNSFLRPIQVSVDHLVKQVTAATDAAGVRRASLH